MSEKSKTFQNQKREREKIQKILKCCFHIIFKENDFYISIINANYKISQKIQILEKLIMNRDFYNQ